MCLAIPGKLLQIDRGSAPVMGEVSFGGIKRSVCLEWLPEVQIGDYVIVHVGFAISKVDEEDALQTLDILRQMGDLSSEPGEGGTPPLPGSL
jgi:hydrogenase expression/formation protein HypC